MQKTDQLFSQDSHCRFGIERKKSSIYEKSKNRNWKKINENFSLKIKRTKIKF